MMACHHIFRMTKAQAFTMYGVAKKTHKPIGICKKMGNPTSNAQIL
jgi:hypothetical protein